MSEKNNPVKPPPGPSTVREGNNLPGNTSTPLPVKPPAQGPKKK